MRTVQMTLDENLVRQVDMITKETRQTRSAFTRQALKEAIDRYHIRRLEEKHRQGYARQPAGSDEFTVWEEEQAWGDE